MKFAPSMSVPPDASEGDQDGYTRPSINGSILGVNSFSQEPMSFSPGPLDGFSPSNNVHQDSIGGFRYEMPNAPPHRQHGIPHANAPYGGYQPFPPHHQQAAPTPAYGLFNNPHAPPFNAPPVHAGTDPLPSSRPQPRSQRTLSSMDVRPDSYRFKFMRSGLADLETCKEIFEGWSKELER